MPIHIGSRFDRYEILSLLGAGGMGEVYLARDTKLDRKVALKILPLAYTHDADRLLRFEKEARAVSALNHPNIITIYEVGQVETAHFIATEYIEGQTLRKKIRRGRVSIGEALDIAVQIAGALHAAHAAGIMHRDIKPENIMLRPDGYVKVLDFGLAKLTELRGLSNSDSNGQSPLEIETDPGLVLGTATYMSPEQARAQRLDGRSDIFSLGIVLYEMIAGRSPFSDQSAGDVMAAILHREPAPLSTHTAEVTPELEQIVHRALMKDREARYQSVKELQADLKRVRPNFPDELAGARKTLPDRGRRTDDGLSEPKSKPEDFETHIEAAAPETEIASAANNTSARIILGEIRKHKRGVIAGLTVFVLVIAGIGFGVAQWLRGSAEREIKPARFTKLSTLGRAIDAVISPDGKYVSYIIDDGGKRSLWIKQTTASSQALQIVPPTDGRFRAPTFSRDGNYVFYVLRRSESPMGELYRVPTLSGPSRKLLSGVSSPVALSPDGTQVTYVRELPGQSESTLLIARVDGTNERELARRKLPESFSIEGPDWSPNGETIACAITNFNNGVNQNVIAVNVADGQARVLTTQLWPSVGRLVWTADGKGILMSAREPSALGRQIWLVSYPSGRFSRVTNDLNDYRGVTASADGSLLAAVQISQISNLWVTPANDSSQTRQITFGSGANDGTQGLAWTSDNHIIYSSNASGKIDLWKIQSDGGQPQQLTVDGNNSFPSVSADGRYIVFNSDRSGSVNVWRMDRDGNNPRQLTFGQLDLDPRCSPDGWVVFSSIKTGRRTLWKVPIDGGDSLQMFDALSEYPMISPDGKWLACFYRDEKTDDRARLAVLPFAGGAPITAFDIPSTPWRLLRWTTDSQSLTSVIQSGGVANLQSQPISGKPAKQVTDFRSNQIFGFDWSPDGKWLASARGLETREIVLISFR